MGLTMHERKAVTRVLVERYRKASKKVKGRILDELIELTDYSRCYGAYLLRRYGKRVRMGKLTLEAQLPVKVGRRPRGRTYDAAVVEVLKQLWQIMDYPCGKRLVVMVAEVLPILEKHQEISPTLGVRKKLLQISAASIDRLLLPERKRLRLRGRSGTKPGTLLKHQIPIRTFTEWDEQQPGFIEIDLVAHDGGNASGDYAQTLNATDVATGWTEPQAIQNKAQVWTLEALKAIRQRLPFPLLGIDSDNGGEFHQCALTALLPGAAHHLYPLARLPQKRQLLYRAEKLHGGASSRRLRALRYASATALAQPPLQPSSALHELLPAGDEVAEQRTTGRKVKKNYDRPKTPYQRVLNSPTVTTNVKRGLKQEYARLNPAQLKREITRLQQKLFRLAAEHRSAKSKPDNAGRSDNFKDNLRIDF